MEDISNLKLDLAEFRNSLSSNPHKWLIEQVKHSILVGKRFLRITFLDHKQYKKIRFPCISQKNIKKDDMFYYDKNANILVTDEQCRKNIEFIKNLGLSWCIGIEWDDSLFSIQRYTLNAVCF